MSNQSLQDIIRAEKEAAERNRQAQEEADRIRKSGAQTAAEIDSQTAAQIDTQRREMLQRMHEEMAGFEKREVTQVKETIAAWQERYNQRREDITGRLCCLISGEKEA